MVQESRKRKTDMAGRTARLRLSDACLIYPPAKLKGHRLGGTMKIVASITSTKFLAEITVEEMEFLAGKQVGYKGNYWYERNIPVGTEFNIVKAFGQIHRNDNRRKEIETVRKTLEGVLNGLDIVDRFIDEPKTEETPAEIPA